jgi:hypothetical protein
VYPAPIVLHGIAENHYVAAVADAIDNDFAELV